MRGLSILGLSVLASAGAAEAAYRNRFYRELHRLRLDVEAAHPLCSTRADFMRFGRDSKGPEASLFVDGIEGLCARAGHGTRLRSIEGAPYTSAYMSVWFSVEISGEPRTFHTFIWSPRRARFYAWYEHCSVKECPAAL